MRTVTCVGGINDAGVGVCAGMTTIEESCASWQSKMAALE